MVGLQLVEVDRQLAHVVGGRAGFLQDSVVVSHVHQGQSHAFLDLVVHRRGKRWFHTDEETFLGFEVTQVYFHLDQIVVFVEFAHDLEGVEFIELVDI